MEENVMEPWLLAQADQVAEKIKAIGGCAERCEHGGICSLPAGHREAFHSASGYCVWPISDTLESS